VQLYCSPGALVRCLLVAVNSFSTQPAYLQVADDLRRQISSGELAPGAKLPPYARLASSYGVGIGTVTKAMQILRDAGLIESGTGGPTYIRDRPARKTAVLRPGSTLVTRMPTPAEREAHAIEPGVPVFEVCEASGGITVYPGDRWAFTTG
jgi:DNA-binding GntR family transcriptional regulator